MMSAATNPADTTPRFVLPVFIALMLVITALVLVTSPPQSFDLQTPAEAAGKV